MATAVQFFFLYIFLSVLKLQLGEQFRFCSTVSTLLHCELLALSQTHIQAYIEIEKKHFKS